MDEETTKKETSKVDTIKSDLKNNVVELKSMKDNLVTIGCKFPNGIRFIVDGNPLLFNEGFTTILRSVWEKIQNQYGQEYAISSGSVYETGFVK